MPIETCNLFDSEYFSFFAFKCIAPDKNATKYFGFSEIISGLALTLVVWTVADLRYKFRIDTATFPVRKASVLVTLLVGFLALFNDYWRASGFRVPAWTWLTPEAWQLLLGAGFFLVLSLGIWVAFFKPAKFGHLNAGRISRNVEMYVLRGSLNELAIVGKELARSASQIVKHTPSNFQSGKITRIEKHALKVFLAMSSPKFCRAAVESSPEVIIAMFDAARKYNKFSSEINIFAKNIVTAAIDNKNSFLYNEKDLYESGLEGVTRPVISAICRSAAMVENVDMLLSPESSSRADWDISQWKAYFHLVLVAFSVHVEGGTDKRPKSLHWAWRRVSGIYSDLNRNLELTELKFDDDLNIRLRTIGGLIKEMVVVLSELDLKKRKYSRYALEDIAELIFSLIKSASSVRSPRRVAHKIQYGLIWSDVLDSVEFRSVAGCKILEIVHSKLQQAIISRPSLDQAHIFGYCLNVMGFTPALKNDQYGSSWRDLHVWLIKWARLEISLLLKKNPGLVNYCFVDGYSYDEKNSRLVHSYEEGVEIEDNYEYLDVMPVDSKKSEVNGVNEACENFSRELSLERCAIYGASFVLCWIGLLRMRKNPLP